MESVSDFVILLDIYGELLSKNQRDVLDMRCNADLSLSEIAEELGGVTRQSVSNSMKKGEQRLEELEQALGFAKRLRRMSAQIAQAKTICGELEKDCGEKDKEQIEKLTSILCELEKEL